MGEKKMIIWLLSEDYMIIIILLSGYHLYLLLMDGTYNKQKTVDNFI
jgi:hypothetical protein